MITPTPRSLRVTGLGLVLALGPVFVAPALWAAWVAFWVLAIGAHAVDAALAPRSREVDVTLELPPSIPVGRTREASLRLRGPLRRLRVRVHLDASEHLAPLSDEALVLADGRADARVPLVPVRRGRAEVEAAWLRWRGPLGLVCRTHRRPLGVDTRVVPDLGHVRAQALPFVHDPELRSGAKVERFRGDGSEFDALEEFRKGHDHRAIDWKSSARHGKLLVRRFRAERNHQVVVAVDTGRLMGEPTAGLPRLDHAVHAALLLSYVGARTGDRVGLYAFDEKPRAFVAARSGMPAFQAVLHASGELDYTTAETNFTLGLTDLATRLRRRSLVVVLTDFVDPVTAELMVDNLQRLSKRHLLVFVALRDPLLRRLVDAPPHSVDALHRAVVADTYLREREVVLRRLRRAGVLCIDAAPDQVGPELIERYLRVKRREMI
ncbi:MAG: DUF58 domain-containing protein [Myxococcota bacterium]